MVWCGKSNPDGNGVSKTSRGLNELVGVIWDVFGKGILEVEILTGFLGCVYWGELGVRVTEGRSLSECFGRDGVEWVGREEAGEDLNVCEDWVVICVV